MKCNAKYQKSSLRAYNTSEQTFATGGNIVFSDIGYQSGLSIDYTKGSSIIYLKSPGLYYITLDVVATDETASTDVIVQMYKNGVAVTGAETEVSIATVGSYRTGTISAVMPVGCGCPCAENNNQISFVVTGTTSVITNANLNIFKLA